MTSPATSQRPAPPPLSAPDLAAALAGLAVGPVPTSWQALSEAARDRIRAGHHGSCVPRYKELRFPLGWHHYETGFLWRVWQYASVNTLRPPDAIARWRGLLAISMGAKFLAAAAAPMPPDLATAAKQAENASKALQRVVSASMYLHELFWGHPQHGPLIRAELPQHQKRLNAALTELAALPMLAKQQPKQLTATLIAQRIFADQASHQHWASAIEAWGAAQPTLRLAATVLVLPSRRPSAPTPRRPARPNARSAAAGTASPPTR